MTRGGGPLKAWGWLLAGTLAGALLGDARVSDAAPTLNGSPGHAVDATVAAWLRHPLSDRRWERAVSDHYRPHTGPGRWNRVEVPLGKAGSKTLVVRGLVDELLDWGVHIREPSVRIFDEASRADVLAEPADLAAFGIHDARSLADRLRTVVETAPSKPAPFEERTALLDRFADDPAAHPDQAQLGTYVRAAGARYLDLTTTGNWRIAIDGAGRLFRRHTNGVRAHNPNLAYAPLGEDRATALAADAAGIATTAELDALIAKRFAALTGEGGFHAAALDPGQSAPHEQRRLRAIAAEDIGDVARFMAQVTRSPDLKLLYEHNASATYQYTGAYGQPPGQSYRMQPLFFNDERAPTTLIVDHDTLRVVPASMRHELALGPMQSGKDRWLTEVPAPRGSLTSYYTNPLTAPTAAHPDLHALGIGNLEAFEAHLARRMVLASGDKRAKEAPLPEARALLQRQIEDAPKLFAAVRGASPALRALYAAWSKDKSDLARIRGHLDLGTKEGLKLQVSSVFGGGIELTVDRGESHPPVITVGELRRLGLGSPDALEKFLIDAQQALGQ